MLAEGGMPGIPQDCTRTISKELSSAGCLFRPEEQMAGIINGKKKVVEVSALIADGNTRMDLRAPEEAIPFYRKALERDPENIEAWCRLGFAISLLKEYSKALECFEKALMLDPNHSEIWRNKAKVLAKEGRYAEAFACFDTALGKNPSDPAAIWNEKGASCLQSGSNEDAAECFERALQLNPLLLGALMGRGIALCRQGRFKEAILCYDKVLENDPLFSRARKYQKMALDRIKQYGGSSQRQIIDF
jgi:tetratricopeptide (TPR) repeat protein